MAQFTSQGRPKALFNRDGVFEARDSPRRFKLVCATNGNATGGLPRFVNHKRKLRMYGSNSLPDSSSSSSSSSSSFFNNYNRLSPASSLSIGEDGIYDDLIDFEMDDLGYFRGLVLDISYRPINVVCWKRAICLEFTEKADVLEYYDQAVNSPSGSFYIPAVLRIPHLLQVVKRRRIKNTLSRRNIFYRDNFTCQYCSSRENLTVDHVLPMARGGEWKWENLVTACASCNSQKGQKILEETNMKLMKTPKAPKDYDIVAIPLTNTAIKMLRMRKGTPEEWLQYIPKPSSEA